MSQNEPQQRLTHQGASCWALSSMAVAVSLLLSACQAPPPAPEHGGIGKGPDGTGTNNTQFVSGLAAPWSMALLADDTLLVSERGSGQVLEVSPSGAKHVVGTVPGVRHQGEGGLLGLAVHLGGCQDNPAPDPGTGCITVYAYLTTSLDNRIVHMPLLGTPGTRSLGPATVIFDGIPKAGNHNGGRIAFGPDGMLYATAGDAGNRNAAQDPNSLSGKILRMLPDGGIPTDNPFPGSPVWSLGHRNPQGIAWDEKGRMWASEFGQNTWDELNEIVPGGNYGWPIVEGTGKDSRFRNPVLTWTTAEASPSGIAIDGTKLYMAALRGERLWIVDLATTPTARSILVGELGRLRDVTLTHDGRLYVLTNNTDGRGTPKPGDDKIIGITR